MSGNEMKKEMRNAIWQTKTYLKITDFKPKIPIFQDLKVHGKDFGGLSGTYSARLLLGDPSVVNGVDWKLGELALSVKIKKK